MTLINVLLFSYHGHPVRFMLYTLGVLSLYKRLALVYHVVTNPFHVPSCRASQGPQFVHCAPIYLTL